MSDNELLLAISNIVRKNTEYLEARLCGTEDRLDNKIDSVEKKLNDKIDCVEQRLNDKIDDVEQRLSSRIDNLDIKIDDVEQRLSSRIDNLDIKIDDVESRLGHEIRKINLKLENDIEPRLQNIENCYISTYERYKTSVEKIDKMQMDIEIIQDVVKEHGEAIQGLIA